MPTDSERLDALEAQIAMSTEMLTDAIDVQKRLICLLHILSANGRLPNSAVAELRAEVDC